MVMNRMEVKLCTDLSPTDFYANSISITFVGAKKAKLAVEFSVIVSFIRVSIFWVKCTNMGAKLCVDLSSREFYANSIGITFVGAKKCTIGC